MTTTLVKRPARIAPPRVPADRVMIAEPPRLQVQPPASMGASMIMMPIISGCGSLLVAVTNPDKPLFAVAGLLLLVGSVGVGAIMLIGQRTGPRRQKREARERYLDYIEDLRRDLRDTIDLQRADAAWRHPEPVRLLDLSRLEARRWERRPPDSDFLVLRAGYGDRPIASQLAQSDDFSPLSETDPVCAEAARQLEHRYSVLHDQPVPLPLGAFGVVTVVGDRPTGRQLATALVAQLLAFHAPEDVRLAIVRDERHENDWDWAKWLPHTQSPSTMDGELPARLIASSVPALAESLRPEIEMRLGILQRRRGQASAGIRPLIVLIDGEHLTTVRGLEPADRSVQLRDLGIHLVALLGSRREEPEDVDCRIVVRDDGTADLPSGDTFTVDRAPDGLLPAMARLLAPLRLVAEESVESLTETIGLPEVLGVPDVAALDAQKTWRPRQLREFLRVPIGVSADARPVMLDFKESAHGGMGPHGLVVGATGSGKSEMLRTLVSSLVINHSPDRLALLLVDFKGGATFAGMKDLPHLAGMITNLADDLTLVDRMRDALYGEMQRRQEILKAAGNLPNVTAYQALRDEGQPLEPLPELLVIVDEFSELLTAKPDFAELFVAVGRIGRSIGVHLLLATQRLEMGKIRGLESHLSYRICLRTFSEGESRDTIGVADAYHLPPEPGSGFLKVDTTIFERFKAALVSAPYQPPDDAPKQYVPVVPYLAVNGVGAWVASMTGAQQASQHGAGDAPAKAGATTVLDVIVKQLATAGGQPVRPVWLEPLPDMLTLDRVQDPAASALPGTVSALVGLVDDPSSQRQFPMEWDFTRGGGNLLVAGAPQSGKTTLLRAMICSMSLRYAPGEVAFYCVDYGGGGLGPLEELPHVAAVAGRVDPERIRRVVGEVATALDQREEIFRQYGLDSMAALRTARAAGAIPADVPADIFLIVDGWGSFREEHEALESAVSEIAARGLNYGVHVILSIGQTMQVRLRMQASFGGRIDLRLNDPFDSAFDRKIMERIGKDTPGRALVEGDLMAHVALPRIDGEVSVDDLSSAQARLIEAARERWPETAVPVVRSLPPVYEWSSLPPVEPGDTGIPVGVSERDLAPAAVSLGASDPHLLVYGDGETGKTNLLRVLLRGAMASYTPEQLGIVVVDYRRTLLDVVPPEYLLAYCTAQQQTGAVASEIAGSMRQRIPGPDVTSEQLRTRTWWKGLEVLFVVDDYDLVAASTGNPLDALVEYVPQARDLGLHLVLARRTGGVSRALFEPLLQRMNDIGTPGLMFSGDRMEGRLVNGIASQRLPVGRALYAGRGGAASQVQVAWLPDS